MDLDPSESINNMGTLRVDILDGKDLPSADRNGYSDPFCKFQLNGETVFKTEVQKKTLHPAWNEYFEVEVKSRTAADFQCKVYDWDFASDPDFLGGSAINLELLDPFQPKEYQLALDGKSGTIRVRMLFRPSYITRSRNGTSTFSGTFATPGKIVTGVAGAPIKGVGMAAHGVGKGASFITRGFKSKKKDAEETNGDVVPVPEMASAGANGFGLKRSTGFTDSSSPVTPPGTALDPGHSRSKSGAGSIYSTATGAPGSAATGTANFTIVSATGYPPSESIMVYVKKVSDKRPIHKTKHIKSPSGQITFNEDFKCPCSADTQFQLQVKAHSTFGSDDDLGESIFFVDESGTAQDKSVAAGSGSVVIRSNFVLTENVTDSPKGGLRRSFLSKKENGRMSREVTPSA
jgi:Ca2+-dependent lipid-binding protein